MQVAELRSAVAKVTRRRFQESKSWLDVFDWKLEKYLTPWILRWSWMATMAIAGVWLVVIVLTTIWPFLPNSSAHASEPSQATVQIRMPDVEAPAWLRGQGYRILSGLTFCALVIQCVLYVRVAIESVIVVFNIAKTLTSIDDRLGVPAPPRQ